MPPLPSDKPATTNHLKLILRIGLSTLFVAVLVYKITWDKLLAVFSEMHLGLAITAFVLLNIGQSFSSWRWQLLASPLGFRERYRQYRALFYIGAFFNLFLPTSIGGDAVRAWYLGNNGKRMAALASVIADRVAGVSAMLVLACLATVTALGELPWWVPVLPWVILTGLLITMALLPRLALYSTKVDTLLQGLGWTEGRWGTWWAAIGISFIVQSLATLQIILLGSALGLGIPWYSYVVVVPLVSLLTMLPISLNGIGVREAGLMLMFAPYGVSTEQALALGMGWFALSVGVGLLGGLYYLFSDRSLIPTEHQTFEQGKDSHEPFNRDSDEGRAGQRQAAA